MEVETVEISTESTHLEPDPTTLDGDFQAISPSPIDPSLEIIEKEE